MAKKLTKTALNKKRQEYDEVVKVELDGSYVDVNTKFKPTKIQKFIEDFNDAFLYFKSKDTNVDLFMLYNIYLIKNFTSAGDMFADKIEQHIDLFEALIDCGYLEPIVKEFNSEELKKLNQQLKNASENLDHMKDILNKLDKE